MAKLSRLIQGQNIAFDTHQAGDRQEVKWKDLHLEKRLHGGGKIRFPLFGDISPSSSEGVSDDKFSKVVSEVKRTLRRNQNLQQQLAESIVSQIYRFKSGEVTVADAQEAANKIADAFDLGKYFISATLQGANAQIIQYSTLHPGLRPGSAIEIVQSADHVLVQKPDKESWSKWKRK